jgi:hypothetical protein
MSIRRSSWRFGSAETWRAVLALALSLPAMTARAQGFPGPGRQFCQIELLGEGAIRPSIDNMILSSRNAGGRAAEAQVTASNSSWQINIDPPAGFSNSPSGGDNATFATWMSASGATNFSATPGNEAMRVRRGRTMVRIDFDATNLNAGFPAGDYSAELTLRCE